MGLSRHEWRMEITLDLTDPRQVHAKHSPHSRALRTKQAAPGALAQAEVVGLPEVPDNLKYEFTDGDGHHVTVYVRRSRDRKEPEPLCGNVGSTVDFGYRQSGSTLYHGPDRR